MIPIWQFCIIKIKEPEENVVLQQEEIKLYFSSLSYTPFDTKIANNCN